MNITINRPPSGGTVKAIASKSQAHRLLICAALSDKKTRVDCTETSVDIEATAGCLRALGARISRDDEGYVVEPIRASSLGDTKTLDCCESGSTLRFMLPVCCALGVTAEFHMSGRLPQRPMSPLLEQLSAHGCTFSGEGSSSLNVIGKLTGGEFNLPGNISSQFISGLLLAPVDGDSVINVAGKPESKPYVDMTLDALKLFGVKIESFDGGYRVFGCAESYKSPGLTVVEGDWSNAAFWLCAGAIGKNAVTCTGLNLKSSQGDMAVVEMLKRFGATVTYGADSVTAAPSKLRGIRIDAGDTPDLVPVLAVVASAAQGETVIYNAERLRIKESDRLSTVEQTLRTLGADITQTRDGLIIKGADILRGGAVSSFGDHRIAMTAAIASIVCKGKVTINGAEAVDKSYPGFWSDFTALGADVTKG